MPEGPITGYSMSTPLGQGLLTQGSGTYLAERYRHWNPPLAFAVGSIMPAAGWLEPFHLM